MEFPQIYKIEKKTIIIEAAVALAMFVFGLNVNIGLSIRIFIFLFAALFLRDAYHLMVSAYVLTKDSIQFKRKDRILWEVPWKNLDMVTRNKKNIRWIVLSDGEGYRNIKQKTENFKKMIQEIILWGAQNPQMKIHESIVGYTGFDLVLDKRGRLEKKSQDLLREKRKIQLEELKSTVEKNA